MSSEQIALLELKPDHLKDLNPPQQEAVLHGKGPILILAGAGSGKTRVLTRRVVHLITQHGVSPQSILAVTFTNKATREMQERLRDLLSGVTRQLPWVSTFHSAGLRILRRHAKQLGYQNDFTVYDAQDCKTLLRKLLKDCDIDEKQYPWREFQGVIDRCKNNCISAEEFARSVNSKSMRQLLHVEVYDRYQKELFKSNAMDFGDLLFNAVRLFEEHPETLRAYQDQIDFLLVDEFQDTNLVQYRLIRQLCGKKNNLLVVGDDDQSIYAFRGASIANILEFEKDFPNTKVVKLEQNYRSSTCILEASHAVISKNKERREKKLWTESGFGQHLGLYKGADEADEAAFISDQIISLVKSGKKFKDIAIFYRTNAQSRAIEEALMDASLPYRIYGGLKFYDRKEIKDIVAYLRLIVSELDNQSFLRVVNTPPRGIGAKAIQSISLLSAQKQISLLQAAVELGESNKNIRAFTELISEIRKESVGLSVGDLIALVVEKSGYGPKLKALKDLTAESRLENLKELEGVARGFPASENTALENIQLFLDRISLTSSDELPVEESLDQSAQDTPDAISLMTLHLAKGLEFPVVFLTGFEEGLLPHKRSLEEPGGVAEERRLCYVGMTRAIEKLFLSRARRRAMFSAGDSFGFSGSSSKVSRFALDIPPSCYDIKDPHTDSFFNDESFLPENDFPFELDDGFAARGFSSKKKTQSKKPISALVSSADKIAAADLTEGLTKVDLPDLKVGLQVVHPSFGPGQIIKIEEATGADKLKSKLMIQFNQYQAPKKIVFKFANLAHQD